MVWRFFASSAWNLHIPDILFSGNCCVLNFHRAVANLRSDSAYVEILVEFISRNCIPQDLSRKLRHFLAKRVPHDPSLYSVSVNCKNSRGVYVTTRWFTRGRATAACDFAQDHFVKVVEGLRGGEPIIADWLPKPEVTQSTQFDFGHHVLIPFGVWLHNRYFAHRACAAKKAVSV